MAVKQVTRGAISAVLPLKVYGRRSISDFARCRILFTSLAKFASRDLFEDIFIIVPAQERRYADALKDEWNSLPIVVVTEEDLVSLVRTYPRVSGWHRQQLIKLHAADLVKTEFFITFDADVILCKPVCADDLVREGKALLQPHDRMAHSKWWAGSAKLLGLPVDLTSPGMAVTPAIFSRTICRRIFEHLEHRYRQASATVLLRRVRDNWTEYCLYYLVAEQHRMLDAYHFLPTSRADVHLRCRSNVWEKSEFDDWDLKGCFDPEAPGFFAVVQSTTGISPSAICHRLGTRLSVQGRLAPSVVHRFRSLWEDIRTGNL
jgi:hypothetical protein